MTLLTVTWNFLKSHWQAILLVFVIIGGVVWIKHQQSVFVDTFIQLNQSHQVEIDKINQARALESQQHAQELKQLQDSIHKIEESYAAAQAQLKQQQSQQQADIVKKYGNDADGLANLLSQKQGFTVVKPVQ